LAKSMPKSRASLRIVGEAATAAFDFSTDSAASAETSSSGSDSGSGSGAAALVAAFGVAAGFSAAGAAPAPFKVTSFCPTLILSPALT
jgi:hypothetical protein